MRRRSLILLAAVVAVAAEGKDDVNARDLKALQGSWQMKKGVHGGTEATAAQAARIKLVISGKTFDFLLADGSSVDKAAFDLDAGQRPARIDLKKGDKTAKGIYLLDGDTLKLCVGRPGTERPREFASPAGSPTVFTVYQRVKK
jgi:uncharacterized protein (TIGR03067 family)